MDKLSPTMLRMLEDVECGLGTHSSAFGRAEHAGRYATARALRKKGLLNFDSELTEEGRAALKAEKEKRNG